MDTTHVGTGFGEGTAVYGDTVPTFGMVRWKTPYLKTAAARFKDRPRLGIAGNVELMRQVEHWFHLCLRHWCRHTFVFRVVRHGVLLVIGE
jgi:hypothetical protein